MTDSGDAKGAKKPAYQTIHVPDHSRAISTLAMSLPVGGLHDSADRPGLAYLTGQMLMRGAGDMDHASVTDALDYLGSSFNIGVGRERSSVSGDTLTRKLDAFETIVATILEQPTFDPEELTKLKRQTVAEIAQVVDRDASVGQRFFVRKLFGDHPYGRPLKGTEASIDAVTIDDVQAFFKDQYRSAGVLVAAAGDITRERLDRYSSRCLAPLNAGAETPQDIRPPTAREGIRLTLVDKPERSQTQVFMGHPTLDANHADYFPLMVGQTIFGGTFTARLSHEIREKRGWSYGAYTYLSTDRHLGTLLTRFYPSVQDTIPAMKVADAMFCDLVRDGVTQDELEATKNYLRNGHVFSVDTPERRLSELVGARLVGRPDDFVDTYVDAVSAVTLADVNDAIRRHLTPDAMEWVVLGTASDLSADLSGWSRIDQLDVHDYRMPITDIPHT